jgi:hypothetical protein
MIPFHTILCELFPFKTFKRVSLHANSNENNIYFPQYAQNINVVGTSDFLFAITLSLIFYNLKVQISTRYKKIKLKSVVLSVALLERMSCWPS